MNETIRSILDRRSNRGFSDQPLDSDIIDTLKQCALASPTAVNLQSWHFTFVTSKDIIGSIEKDTIDAFRAKADDATVSRIASRNNSIFYGAPLVVFVSSDDDSKWGHIDAGIAVENLAVAAQSLGLGSVIIGLCGAAFAGDNAVKNAKLLDFPEKHSFSIAIAIGHPTVTKDAHPIAPGKISEL